MCTAFEYCNMLFILHFHCLIDNSMSESARRTPHPPSQNGYKLASASSPRLTSTTGITENTSSNQKEPGSLTTSLRPHTPYTGTIVLLRTTIVKLTAPYRITQMLWALLNSGSRTGFIPEHLAQLLNAPRYVEFVKTPTLFRLILILKVHRSYRIYPLQTNRGY